MTDAVPTSTSPTPTNPVKDKSTPSIWTTVNDVQGLRSAISANAKNILIKNGNYDLAGEQINLYSGITILGEALPSDSENSKLDGVYVYNETGNCFVAANNNRVLNGIGEFDNWIPEDTFLITADAAKRGVYSVNLTTPPEIIIPAGSIVEIKTSLSGQIYEENIVDQEVGLSDNVLYLKYPLAADILNNERIYVYVNPVKNIRIENIQTRASRIKGERLNYVGMAFSGVDGLILKNIMPHWDSTNTGPYGLCVFNASIENVRFRCNFGFEYSRNIRISDGVLADSGSKYYKELAFCNVHDLFIKEGIYPTFSFEKCINVYIANVGIHNTFYRNRSWRSAFSSCKDIFMDNINILGDTIYWGDGLVSINNVTNAVFNNIFFGEQINTLFYVGGSNNNVVISNCNAPKFEHWSEYTDVIEYSGNNTTLNNFRMYNNSWQEHYIDPFTRPSDGDILTYGNYHHTYDFPYGINYEGKAWVAVPKTTLTSGLATEAYVDAVFENLKSQLIDKGLL